jgi:hypothetical protein
MGHTLKVDRLLIRTAAGQAGIGNNDGQIVRQCTRQEPGPSRITGHAVVTDTNPHRSR